jgi:hypothetical protein
MRHAHSIFALSLFVGLATHAATYNIYFTNTEQGPNSQASPTVTVTGVGPVPVASPNAPASAAIPQSILVQTPAAPREERARESRWTVTGMYGSATSKSTSSYANRMDAQEYAFSVAYRLHRTFSAGLDASLRNYVSTVQFDSMMGTSGGSYSSQTFMAGFSLEWLPITLELGSHRLFELGPIVQVHHSFEYNEVDLHAGARAIVNLAPTIGVVASYRRWLRDDSLRWFDVGLRVEL